MMKLTFLVLSISISLTTFGEEHCNKFEVEPEEISVVLDPFESIHLGDLLKKDRRGVCVPTKEKYILGRKYGVYTILGRVSGHTVSIQHVTLGQKNYWFVQYNAYANSRELKIFEVNEGSLYELQGPRLYSNLNRIEMTEETIKTVSNFGDGTIEKSFKVDGNDYASWILEVGMDND